MFRQWILSIAIYIIVAQHGLSEQRQVKVSVFQINNKKPIHTVSDKFLSFTVDPSTLIHAADCQITNTTLSLIKGLLPAYLRVAGTDSNRLTFKSVSDGKLSSELSSNSSSVMDKSKNLILSGNYWNKFYEFVSATGLNLIVCLSGGASNERTERDLSNALEFIMFSNKNNFSMNWQLGYELQKISRDDGKETGQDVAKLRKILDIFPRYQNSLILGPDMTNVESRENLIFLRNYLGQAQNSLNVFTMHPNFTGIPEKDLYDALSNILAKMDTYFWQKDGIFKSVSKGVVVKKPIWMAESENKDPVCKFSDSMSLVKRLGCAAKLGISVYLRKPHLLSLYEATSEYWVSSLFKALVGRSVLDMKLANGNNSSVFVFSHCTQMLAKPEDSVINPAVAYERGSITVFGVNGESEPSRLAFKTGIKTDETVHLYVLTEDFKNGLGKTLLNRQHIGLSDENELPMITPKIRESAKYVVVPPRSIFFLVFPNVKCRACMLQMADDNQDAMKTKIKLTTLEEEELANVTSDTSEMNNISESFEDPEDEDAVYVSYPKKSERIKAAQGRYRPTLMDHKNYDDMKQSKLDFETDTQIGPKYITFSDDTWLSSLPEKMEEIVAETSLEENPSTSQMKKDKHSKVEMYKIMAQAMTGKRNTSTGTSGNRREYSNFQPDENNGDAADKIRRLTRFTRSLDLSPSSRNSLSLKMVNGYSQNNDAHSFPHDKPISDDLEDPVMMAIPWYMENRKRREVVEENSSAPLLSVEISRPTPSAKSDETYSSESENNDITPKIRTETPQESRPIINLHDSNKTIAASSTEKKKYLDATDKMNALNMQSELVSHTEKMINVRQNREIDDKSAENENSDSDTKSKMAEGRNAQKNILGPISPFTRHHVKATKTKLKNMKTKKSGKKSVNSLEGDDPAEEVASNNEDHVLRGHKKLQADDSVASKVHSPANVRHHPSIPELRSVTSELEMTSTHKHLAESKTSSSSLENLHLPAINQKHKKGDEMKPEDAQSAQTQQSANFISNNADKDEEAQLNEQPENMSPNERSHLKVEPSAWHATSHHKNGGASILHPSIVHPRPAVDIKAKPKINPTATNHTKRLRTETTLKKLPPLIDANQLLDLARARFEEMKNIRRAKQEEIDKMIQEKLISNRRTAEHIRNKRETIDNPASAMLESINSGSRAQNSLPSTSNNDNMVVSQHQKKQKLRHQSTHFSGSSSDGSLTPHHNSKLPTANPRKEKPARKQLGVHQKTTSAPLRYVTIKSSIADKHKLISNPAHTSGRPEKLHHRGKRDVLDDFLSTVKDVYADVTTDVKKNIGPVKKWMEEKSEDIKEGISSQLRQKRDLQAFRQRLQEQRQTIRQKIREKLQKHRIQVRDVAVHHPKQMPKNLEHHSNRPYERKYFTLLTEQNMNSKTRQGRRNHENYMGHVKQKREILQNFSDIKLVRNDTKNELLFDGSENEIFIEKMESDNEDLTNSFNNLSSGEDKREFSTSMTNMTENEVENNNKNFSDHSLSMKSISNSEQCTYSNYFIKLWCQTLLIFSSIF